jgi:hypothetical protein
MRLLAALVALLLMLAGICLAAPLPTEMIVNYTTKECSSFFAGDECSDCTPPAGWERLGAGAECPEGFALVEVEGSCHGLHTGFCCIEGHSGAPGDCTGLVKNVATEECAFVDNLSCSLPAGWLLRAENASGYEWLCPGNYSWTTVNCTSVEQTSSGSTSDSSTLGSSTSGNSTLGNSTPVKSTSNSSSSGGCPCHG